MADTTIRWAVCERLIALIRTRTVSDGVTVNGDQTVTSATAAFVATDVGRPIAGTGIPSGATIASLNSATSIELSAAATASGTAITLTIGDATLDGVQVEPGFPGDAQEAQSVWISDLDGVVEIPVMSAGRKYRDDRFDIPFQIRVAGLSDLDATMTRLSEIVAAIENVLADDPGLDALDGLLAAQITSERMTSADLRAAGRIGFGEVVISCHARLQ